MRINVLVCAVVVLVVWTAAAGAQAPSCESQLAVERAHDHLIATKRGDVERQLAILAVRAEELGKQVQQLTQERDALKAMIEAAPATPQTEDTQE